MIDIQQLIQADQHLLLQLNGSESLFWDGVMWTVSDTKTWIPAAVVLLYVIFKNCKLSQGMLVLLTLAVVVLCADQFSSGLCKNYFMRFRPSQEPALTDLVHIVNGYRGGAYGFISSHAANTFAIAVFVSLLIRNGWLAFTMLFWALVPSYSRIYLGVHYPGDIIFGAIAGSVIAIIGYVIFLFLQKKLFRNPQYISSQYTGSGFKTSDVCMIQSALLLSFIYVIVAGMMVARNSFF